MILVFSLDPPVVTDWETWMECSASCGPGTRNRTRECMPDGECPEYALVHIYLFYLDPPVVTCWETWMECSASCGPGTRNPTREYIPYSEYPKYMVFKHTQMYIS